MIKIIVLVIVILIIIIALFLNLSPQFGGSLSREDAKNLKKSKNFKNGKFRNEVEVSMMSDIKLGSIVNGFKNKDTIPKRELPIDNYLIGNGEKTKVVWFGHSSLLVEIDGKNILIDPMLSERPSPVPIFVKRRFGSKLPINIEEINKIDAVLISHDHYDHLDYKTIKVIKNKVGMFYVPLAVGSHLRSWGVKQEKIVELDWWQEAMLDDIAITATPSQHFSGRGLFNRNSTLWCSWVIKGTKSNLFFSGDTGYHKGFKEIGEKYGPFDLTMMECGQYNDIWPNIHMVPEQTVQAHKDLKGKVLLPIHWSAFKLSTHSWNDPAKRVTVAAKKLGVTAITPKIGEEVIVGEKTIFESWWENI